MTGIVKLTPADAGCWVDGHWGQYAVAHMVNRAEELGYGRDLTSQESERLLFLKGLANETSRMGVDNAEELDSLRALRDAKEVIDLADRHLASMGPSTSPGLTDDEHEALSDAADSVEQWLNDNVTPEGYHFEWLDGEFYLTEDEDECEDEPHEDSPALDPPWWEYR